jgi:hypothetical protein
MCAQTAGESEGEVLTKQFASCSEVGGIGRMSTVLALQP